MTSEHPLTELSYSKRIAKRAQYEAFEFSLTDGGVTVRNCSHANPAEHEYRVTVTDGLPSHCTCPADARFDGACKHRVAVAIRRPLLDAATTQVATDGGLPETASENVAAEASDGQDESADSCAECLDWFPCWDCVRTSRKELPE